MHAKCMKCQESSHVTSPRAAGAAPAEDGMGGEGRARGSGRNKTEMVGQKEEAAAGIAPAARHRGASGGGRVVEGERVQ